MTEDDPARCSSFADLEREARELVRRDEGGPMDTAVTRSLRRQIEMTLASLDHARTSRERMARDLVRVECYVWTDMHQLELGASRYVDNRAAERGTLTGRLLHLGQERRRLQAAQEERLLPLYAQLLTLLSRHEQLAL